MILIVVIECILAILLIAVIGKAMESFFYEVSAREICFTTFTDDVQTIVKEDQQEAFERTADGKVILKPGMLYKEKEKTVEKLPNENYSYEGAVDDIIIEYVNPENLTLAWYIDPEDVADKAVTFICDDPDVEVEATGRVHFFGEEIVPVQVTIMTKNSKSATVILMMRKGNKPISMPD